MSAITGALAGGSSKSQLHWTQRVALVRHNLHAASRSNDFTFFKTLQAIAMLEGTNHVATLSSSMGDDADSVLAAMDNLNTGLAYVHQDAFKNVYDSFKNNMREADKEVDQSKLYVDITMQKNMADMAIDKMASSAIGLINQQPSHVQDQAANVWIAGALVVSEAMQISLREMDALNEKLDDFIRLEESWNTVKASIVCSITGLKGIFSMMDCQAPQAPDSKGSTRAVSIASASSAMFRRLSTAFGPAGPTNGLNGQAASTPAHSRNNSVSSTHSANFANFNRNNSNSSTTSIPVYQTPNYVRSSVSNGCPTSMPPHVSGDIGDWRQHKLSTIPHTPANCTEEDTDPFDTSGPPIPEMDLAPHHPIARPVGTPGSLAQRRLSQMMS